MADIAVVAADVTFRIPTNKTELNYPYQAGIASEEIDPGEAVYMMEDGEIALAFASGTSLQAKCIGLAANHAREGQVVSVCGPEGDADLGVDLEVGVPLYLSVNNAGKICPYIDVEGSTGSYVVQLGTVTEERNFHQNIQDLGIQL